MKSGFPQHLSTIFHLGQVYIIRFYVTLFRPLPALYFYTYPHIYSIDMVAFALSELSARTPFWNS